MNFELTEDQQLIKDMVKDFSSKEIMPKAKALEDNSEFPKDLFNKLAELGILGMTVSTEYEGTEADRLSFLLAIEEISRFFPSLGVILSVHSGLFCYSILKYGSKQQKDRYLPDSVKGKLVGAFSLSEPGAGSDAMNLKTKAKKVDNHYLLNGIKAWVTNGAVADAFIVFAKTESDMAKKKISAFIVEKNFPGFSVSKVEEKMGLHASQTAEITLEDCKVPVDNL
ncbi:MAG: acyl-CoA dehydrogenase family protein, partial [Candidatus Aminicenantaceae bacterium]